MLRFPSGRTRIPGRVSRELAWTTALALVLTIPAMAAADTIYWDVGERDDGVIEGGSGEWSNSFDQNWTDEDGEDNTRFRTGDTVVFGESTTANPVVDVRGTVAPAAIDIRATGYTFTGGRIGQRDTDLRLDAASGTITTFRNELRGNVSIDEGGTIVLEGRSGNLGAVSVGQGTALVTRGDALTSGNMTSSGALQINGRHNGNVTVTAEGTLSFGTTGLISGNLTNAGRVAISGRVFQKLTNQSTGTVTLYSGARLGEVENLGTADLRGNVTVDGDFSNAEDATMTVGAGRNASLSIGDDFINEGAVILAPTGSLAITADNILLRETSVIAGNIALRGRVENAGQLTFTGASELTETLTNLATGAVQFSADMDADGNEIRNAGDMTLGAGVTLTDGDILNQGTLTTGAGSTLDGDLVTNGTANLTGRITGSVTDTGGTLNVTGPLDVAGNLRADGTEMAIGGDLSVDGTLELDGEVTGSGNVTAGRLENEGSTQLSGNLDVAGDFDNRDDAVLDVAGAVTGNLLNAGEATFGALTGAIRNIEGAVLSVAGALTGSLQNAGTALVSGGIVGSVENDDAAVLTVDGNVTGNLLNRGTVNLTGDTTVVGVLQSSGRINVTGSLAATRLELTEGSVLDSNGALATDILNDGNVRLAQGLTGALTNAGTVDTGAGAVISGAVDNRNLLRAEGDLSVGGGMVNTGEVRLTNGDAPRTINVAGGMRNDGIVNLGGGTSGDRLAVDGGLSGNGEYVIGFSPSLGVSDQIVVTNGATTGTLTLRFSLAAGDAFDVLRNPLLIVDADDSFAAANDYEVSWSGLPDPSESFVYSLGKQPTGDLVMIGQVNPGIGALSGNVILTESLIGTVINRPSSPFVVGRAYQDDKACGPGGWARAVGGKATAQGGTTNGESRLNSEIDASYHGIQFGGDMACFDGAIGGWDMAVGVIGGLNRGSTTQPVFAVDPENAEQLTNMQTSTTKGDFEQRFGGVYLTATRGRFTSDLQFRVSKTEYELNNTPSSQGFAGLGLTDAKFNAEGRTVSGSASYAFPLAREGLSVVPTVGFAWNEVDVDRIRFDNGSTLDIDGADSRIGFAGATLSWTTVADSGIAALNRFVTVTHYKDFADDITSVYSMRNSDGEIESETLTSDNLGAYSELSLGVNYMRVLDQGGWGPGRQFNASMRVDARSGASLDSWGLTGQVRWQF